ncbi:MAG: hypothetical protein ACKVQS_09290 [Fimbriimonadaceae bacterium]
MKVTATLSGLILSCLSFAQVPDIIIAVDLRPTLLFGDGRTSQLRWFDAYALPSTVGFKGRMADGKRFAVTQRLARYISDGDPDQVDEFYLESPGDWKIGKQVLPFGQHSLYRETAPAIRLHTNLVFENAPLDFAVTDAGTGRPSGIIGRLGKNTGLSFAIGENFGVQDTAFAILRQDISGAGKNHGYKSIYGLDTVLFKFPLIVEGEIIFAQQGQTASDQDMRITDIRASYQLGNGKDRVSAGWAREWLNNVDSFRLDGEFVLANQVVLMPHVRFGGRGLTQFGTTIRFRL